MATDIICLITVTTHPSRLASEHSNQSVVRAQVVTLFSLFQFLCLNKLYPFSQEGYGFNLGTLSWQWEMESRHETKWN